MSDEQLFDIIASTNLELQKLLCQVAEICAVNHPNAASNVPQDAFRNVLNHLKPQLKNAIKSFSATKLFTSTNCDTLLPIIVIQTLDSGLILQILLKVEEFLQIARTTGHCVNGHTNKCCNNCNHSSAVCGRCISGGGIPSRNCKHKCQNCSKTFSHCPEYGKICCLKCKKCVACNQEFSKIQMCVFAHLIVSTSQEPCTDFLFLYCLGLALKWRNLFGHVTLEELQQFLDRNNTLSGFDECKTIQQLFNYIKSVFTVIIEFVKDVVAFPVLPLTEDKQTEVLNNLSLLFKAEESKKYWHKNSITIKEVFLDSVNITSQLKQSIKETEERMIDLFIKKLGKYKYYALLR